MKSKIFFFGLKTAFFLLLLGLFFSLSQPGLAQTENIKETLQHLVENLDQLSKTRNTPSKITSKEEFKTKKNAFADILQLANIENNNLKNKLIEIKNLNREYQERRNQLLKELGNQSNYYETLAANLEKETNLKKLKELAAQFRDWRRVVYHPALKNIVDFLLVFDARAALNTTERRFQNIQNDLKKVAEYNIIKTSPLPLLLEKAEELIIEAQKIQQAAELIIIKSNQSDIQQLIEEELEKIKAIYSLFLEMNVSLQTLKNNPDLF